MPDYALQSQALMQRGAQTTAGIQQRNAELTVRSLDQLGDLPEVYQRVMSDAVRAQEQQRRLAMIDSLEAVRARKLQNKLAEAQLEAANLDLADARHRRRDKYAARLSQMVTRDPSLRYFMGAGDQLMRYDPVTQAFMPTKDPAHKQEYEEYRAAGRARTKYLEAQASYMDRRTGSGSGRTPAQMAIQSELQSIQRALYSSGKENPLDADERRDYERRARELQQMLGVPVPPEEPDSEGAPGALGAGANYLRQLQETNPGLVGRGVSFHLANLMKTQPALVHGAARELGIETDELTERVSRLAAMSDIPQGWDVYRVAEHILRAVGGFLPNANPEYVAGLREALMR